MSLQPVLSGDVPPGRYRLAGTARVSALRASVLAAGWAWGVVDGRRVPDRPGLFAQYSTALEFPGWFGGNWDAFADCLQDLSWLPARGYVVLWNRASAADDLVRSRAEEIIDDAIGARVQMGLPPLYIVYAEPMQDRNGDGLERLSA